MTKDEILMQEAIDAFSKLRHWINPDFYREQILPVVNKLKDRVNTYTFTKKISEPELDTVPSALAESITNFGLFKDD